MFTDLTQSVRAGSIEEPVPPVKARARNSKNLDSPKFMMLVNEQSFIVKTMKTRNGEKYFRIINAATKIFARKGFFQAKVSDIAREAQVADGTIYLYFDNKDDILISLFEEQMKAVLENMIDQIAAEKDAVKKIEKFALTHMKLI